MLDDREAFRDARQPRLRGGEIRVGDQLRPADDLHQRLPGRRLDDHVDIVVGAARSAAQRRPRLAAARRVAGARHGVAEFLGRVFEQRPVFETLLVAHLDPAQIQHRIDHRHLHPLASAGALALEQRRQDARTTRCTPVPLSPICAPVTVGGPSSPAGRAGRPAHALRDILIGLEIGVAAGPEPLDRGVDDARIDLRMRSQVKPWRSSTPGPKFSTITSHLPIMSSSTFLPPATSD